MNPAPSKSRTFLKVRDKYSVIKAIRFDKPRTFLIFKYIKQGTVLLKKENRPRDLRFNELNTKEGAG